MNYINAFNKSIKNLFKQSPNNQTILLIKDYMQKRGYRCYYTALDTLGFTLGIEYQYQQLVEDDEVVGYYAAIKFRKGNPLNKPSTTELLRNDPFECDDKCFYYLAKEYVYTLMRVPNLKQYVE